ncbi:MAG: phosphate ABC transporter permease PstA [Chloroflexia bacterium]|nr:phosphate ABC transporter permease PstA [Chloroflexia bacterium]
MSPVGVAVGSGNLAGRQTVSRVMTWVLFGATAFAVVALVVLLITVFVDALPWLRPELVRNMPSRTAENAGVYPALVGSMWLIAFTALFAFPIGVASAIYLEEYAPNNRWTRFLAVNIQNLAGVPSVVYGLLGLAVFVVFLRLERSILSGALTMALLILPVVIIASREAIRAVPPSLREAAYGLGATRWQVTRSHVLPLAFPGILTGIILSISRALGETAPLIVVGASAYVTFTPNGILDKYTVLPMQIYEWSRRPGDDFQGLAAGAIVVLLVLLLLLNAVAIYLRARAASRMRW